MTKWDSRIHFIPQWTSPRAEEDLMANSDIVICPSGHEGFSLVPAEGMAMAKAVAVTDIPVHRELLSGKNGYCGLLMPPTDHTEFVNDIQSVKVPSADIVYGTLKYLLENPDEAKIMGENALVRIHENYSLRMVCEQWFNLLKTL
jgi:glycosyltransferase involved in cell wall biosynthesis